MARGFKITREMMAGFDDPFGPKKLQPEQRFEAVQEHGTVQGCGNPNCPICVPKDGRPGSAKLSGGDPAESMRRAMDEAIRGLVPQIFSFSLGGDTAAPTRPAESAEYRKAKAKVEDYLLAISHELQWDDVVGNEAARTALIEAIEHPVTNADLYRQYGMKPGKGVLLFGPPGCGKTMFGKAAAAVIARLHGKEALLVKINGPEIQSPFVGKTEQLIREIFAFARIYAREKGHPLTIFMDEADALLPSRSGRAATFEISNVSTFLAEMDGIEGSGAFVILATNRPEAIDPALLRDGRCDRKIKVERPSKDASLHILARALRGAPLADPDADIVALAIEDFFSADHVLTTFTVKVAGEKRDVPFHLRHIVNGAMLVGLAERAKGIAFRRDLGAGTRSGVSIEDFRQAIREVLRENTGLDHSFAVREFIEALPDSPLLHTRH